MSELNARLRRIVAAFQKSHKRELLKQEQNEKVRMLSSFYLQCVNVGQVFLALNLCKGPSKNIDPSSLQRPD